MLIGCMSVWNEATLIGPALESLLGVVDRAVVVDGAVEEYPARGLSSDETMAIARSLGAATMESAWPVTEHFKRSLYFVGRPGDWYLVLDGDEILIPRDRGALRLAVNQCAADSMSIDLIEPGKRDIWQTPRLIRHVDGMLYWPDHCEVWAGPRCVMSHNRPRPSIEEHNPYALILHLPGARGSRVRDAERAVYHENLSRQQARVYADRRAGR